MRKPYLYFTITRKCNLRCRHCYLSAGPEHSDTTISKKDFKRIIDNLPKVPLDLWLSGGEIFTIQDTLFDYLQYIKEKNLERADNKQGWINVGLQTNGFWAVDDKEIKAILFALLSLDVKYIDISSKDKYHREQGIRTKDLKKLYSIVARSGLFEEFRLRGARRSSIMPIGRAKKMNLRDPAIQYEWYGCKDVLSRYQFTIREDGRVYTCCYGFFPLPGNLIEEPLTEIVRKAKKDERLSIIDFEGIEGLAIHDDWKPRDAEDLISAYGECGFCYKFYQKEASNQARS